jgi:hypothetical protein
LCRTVLGRLLASDLEGESLSVFDVMSRANSSPRREAASTPLPRSTTLKKAVTICALQLQSVTCSYRDNPSSISDGDSFKYLVHAVRDLQEVGLWCIDWLGQVGLGEMG